MADKNSGQEPDEFGVLSGGVSDLRSRFEQLSKSENSRPTSSSGSTASKDLKSKHNFGQTQKGIVMGQMLPSNGKLMANSATMPSRTKKPSPDAMLSSQQVSDMPPSAATSTLESNSIYSYLAPQKAPAVSLSATSSANSSTTDLHKHVYVNKDPSPRPSHSRKVSAHKSPSMPPCKLGEAVPSLRPAKSFVGRESSSASASASATASASASANASASTSDAENTILVKVPPPRPPKPGTSSHGIHILDESDLERLASEGTTSRVSNLAHMFGNNKRDNKSSNTGSTLKPARLNTSQHFLKHSRSNEAMSPSGSTGTVEQSQHKHSPPTVPPRPMKADDSSESLEQSSGDAAVPVDKGSSSGPVFTPITFQTTSPPPLPSREGTTNKDVNSQSDLQRRKLSASKSTSSLPLFRSTVTSEATDLPPLPVRKPSGTDSANRPVDIPGNTSARLPPPQRAHPASKASSSVHRANTIAAKARPIPKSSLAARGHSHAHSLSPNEIDQSSPLLPPPIRSANNSAKFSRSLASSSFASTRQQTDSSDEDDDEGAFTGSFSSSSSFKTPLGMRKPHSVSEITPSGLPDTSHANRRAPQFRPDCCTSAKQGFQCFAVCGHTVVTGSGDKVKVYRVGESATGGGEKLCTVGEHLSKEVKVTALEFRPPNHGIPPIPAVGKRSHGETADEGRYLWCGTKDGHIWELDVAEAQVVYSRQNVHNAAIQLLKRVGNKMLSLDESGKISVWLPSSDPDPAIAGLRLSNQPITQRIAIEKGSYACVLGQQLWVATGPSTQKNAKDYAGSKGPRIRVYNPFADDKPFNATSKALIIPAEMAEGVGVVTGGTLIPTRPDYAYLGHDSGHISIWSRQNFECVGVRKLGPHGLTAVAGVIKYLWVATRAGTIAVFDTECVPWRALKIWTAHKEPITSIKVDEHGIEKAGRLQVASGGMDATVHLWDGTLSYDWLQSELSKREHEFCTYRCIKTLNITFNIDAASPADLETSAENMEVFPAMLRNALQVGSDGVSADRPPDIIVFGFQELIDLESKKLTAKSLLLGSGKKKANDMGDRVSSQYRAWYDKLIQIVRYAMPPTCGYLLVQSESLVGLFTCVFVKQSEFKNVRELAISTVKTGMGGRYGNKGAVIARLVIQDTSLAFVNCHLAAGQKHVKQRNADVADILEYPTVFEDPHADPAAYVGGGDGSMVLDHELCFWSGDLNYRIDHSRETVVNAIMTRKHPALLEQDQLRKELRMNPAFRLKTFSEAPINFLPTYKYDRGTHEWDTSEKNRIPAWCDRILFRSHHPDRIKCLDYGRWECTVSDHRPVSAVFEVKIKAADQKKRIAVEDQLKVKWKELEKGILGNLIRWYLDPQ